METQKTPKKTGKNILLGNIFVNELINEGYEESFYEWHSCPKCKKNGLSIEDNYCSGCGVKILK